MEEKLRYESELHRQKEIQNRLNKEVMDLTAKLMAVNCDKKDLLGKLEAAYNRLQYSEEQKSALQVIKIRDCKVITQLAAIKDTKLTNEIMDARLNKKINKL